jgi:hypothetical protein
MRTASAITCLERASVTVLAAVAGAVAGAGAAELAEACDWMAVRTGRRCVPVVTLCAAPADEFLAAD